MGQKKIQTRLDRLDQLTGLLKSADIYTAADLAASVNVSPRTLMRDLEVLKNRGYPIETEKGRGGGIRLHPHWGVGRLILNYHEVIDLLLSLAIMEKLAVPLFLDSLKALRNKISASFPSQKQIQVLNLRKRILVGEIASNMILDNYKNHVNKKHQQLYESFFELKKLSISYQDEYGNLTNRVIETHYLLVNWPVWYVLAWDHLRNDTRCFRVDRISAEKKMNEKFRVKPKNLFENEIDKYSSNI